MRATNSHILWLAQMKKLKITLASHWKKSTTISPTSLPLELSPVGIFTS